MGIFGGEKEPQSRAEKPKIFEQLDRSSRLRWGRPYPEELKLNQWFETLTAREQDALVLSRAQAPDAGFRNVSQSLGREHSTSFCTETLGPHDSPKPAAFCGAAKAARLMLGQEALLFQGFPLCSFLALVEKMKKSIDMHEQPSSCSRRKRHSEPKKWLTEALMTDL